MELRDYKETDAKEILKWIKNEREFRLWSADRYKNYPINADDINNNYNESKKLSAFYPMTLTDEGRIVGHIILRKPSVNKDIIRFGFIIVDSNLRGKGYGKKLITESIKYAKNNLNADEINLGVFVNNESALNCYKSVGFIETELIKNAYHFYDENWDEAEMVLKKKYKYSQIMWIFF